MRLGELCLDVLQQNQEHHAEVREEERDDVAGRRRGRGGVESRSRWRRRR